MRSILGLPFYTLKKKCSQVLRKLLKVTLHLNNKTGFKSRAVRLQTLSASYHKIPPRARGTKSLLLNKNHRVLPVSCFLRPHLLTSLLTTSPLHPSLLVLFSHDGSLPSSLIGQAHSYPRVSTPGELLPYFCMAHSLSLSGSLLKCHFRRRPPPAPQSNLITRFRSSTFLLFVKLTLLSHIQTNFDIVCISDWKPLEKGTSPIHHGACT